jgi:hypothetical protein
MYLHSENAKFCFLQVADLEPDYFRSRILQKIPDPYPRPLTLYLDNQLFPVQVEEPGLKTVRPRAVLCVSLSQPQSGGRNAQVPQEGSAPENKAVTLHHVISVKF